MPGSMCLPSRREVPGSGPLLARPTGGALAKRLASDRPASRASGPAGRAGARLRCQRDGKAPLTGKPAWGVWSGCKQRTSSATRTRASPQRHASSSSRPTNRCRFSVSAATRAASRTSCSRSRSTTRRVPIRGSTSRSRVMTLTARTPRSSRADRGSSCPGHGRTLPESPRLSPALLRRQRGSQLPNVSTPP
jgi:hypothetical protein